MLLSFQLIDEASTAECMQMLMKILNFREEKLGIDHLASAESYFVLGLLHRYTKNYPKAREYATQASEIYIKLLGEDNPVVQIVKKMLHFLNNIELVDLM